jgi:hypothetical protein
LTQQRQDSYLTRWMCTSSQESSSRPRSSSRLPTAWHPQRGTANSLRRTCGSSRPLLREEPLRFQPIPSCCTDARPAGNSTRAICQRWLLAGHGPYLHDQGPQLPCRVELQHAHPLALVVRGGLCIRAAASPGTTHPSSPTRSPPHGWQAPLLGRPGLQPAGSGRNTPTYGAPP